MIEPTTANTGNANAGHTNPGAAHLGATNAGSGKPAPIDPQDPARYTERQEREMGVTDDSGRKIQPAASFVMIALTFVGVAAVAVVIVAIVMRVTGGPAAGQ